MRPGAAQHTAAAVNVMPSKRLTSAVPGEHGEHTPLLRAAQNLEDALANPGSNPSHTLRERLLEKLRLAGADLRQHCESTEQHGGTLAELEIVIGRLYQLTAVRREHRQLLALADDLTAALAQADNLAALSSVHVQLHIVGLTATLRVHCVNETDLVQIRFNLDIGGYG